jgi:hypothetical protein
VHLLGNSHYETEIHPITKPKSLQENYAQYDFDYGKKNPQQNTSKLNMATYKQSYIP